MFERLKPYMICILKPCDDDTDIAIGDIHYKIENTIFFDDPELCLDKQDELIESGKISIILNAFSIQHEMIVNERFCVQQEFGIDDVNYEVKQQPISGDYMIKDFINSFIGLILMCVWFIVFKNSDQPIGLIVLTWVMSLICVFLLFAQAMYKAELEILSGDE